MGTSATSLPIINKEIMQNGPKLTHDQQLSLCEEVSDVEIYEGLCVIHKDKAPGVDGYNSCFLKKAWPIIKQELMKAIQDFFTIGRLYKYTNCTAITVVPKVNNPSTLKNFRPIVCCSVICNIIFKVLADRLQRVIPSIINEAQAGFTPERKIADNVIISHELVKAYTRKNTSPKCMIKIDLNKALCGVNFLGENNSGAVTKDFRIGS